MRLSTSWQRLITHKGTMREQSRRESNGRKHNETMEINAEIAGDNPQPRIKRVQSVDKARVNQALKVNREIKMHSDIREAFGPRLVKSDGTATYTFQYKRK
jgi:hypothetical protein